MHGRTVALGIGLALAGCAGGNEGGTGASVFCDSMVSDRVMQDSQAWGDGDCGQQGGSGGPLDGNLATYTWVKVPEGCSYSRTIWRQRDAGFLPGTKVGVFISRSANFTADMITVRTFSGGSDVESASGSDLEFEPVADVTQADEYAYLTTTLPYNGVGISIDVSFDGAFELSQQDPHSGTVELSLYEICGDGGRVESGS